MPKPWGQPNKTAAGVLNAQGRIDSNDLGQTGVPDFVAQAGYNVIGDFSQLGNEITITKEGGGFGTKPGGEKPVYVALWEDGYDSHNPDPDLSRDPSLSISGATNRREIVEGFSPKTGGNSSEYTTADVSSAGHVQFTYTSTGREVMFAKRRTGFDQNDVPASGQKEWRIWAVSAGGNHNVYWDTGNGGKITTEFLDSQGTIVDNLSNHRWDATKDTWADEKIVLKQSSGLDVSDAETWWYLKGFEAYSGTFISRTTDRPEFLNVWVGPQDQKTAPENDIPEGEKWWLGLLYFDDSFCHAVLTDSATFADSGVVQEVQPIKGWVDDQVKIHLRRREGLNHLHIINSNYDSFYVGEIS